MHEFGMSYEFEIWFLFFNSIKADQQEILMNGESRNMKGIMRILPWVKADVIGISALK